MRILSARIHGYIDFGIVGLLLVGPALLPLSSSVATLCYALATAHLLLSLFTCYPLGAARRVPLPVHGALELAEGAVLLAAPWIFDFPAASLAPSYLAVIGGILCAVWLATPYGAAGAGPCGDRTP